MIRGSFVRFRAAGNIYKALGTSSQPDSSNLPVENRDVESPTPVSSPTLASSPTPVSSPTLASSLNRMEKLIRTPAGSDIEDILNKKQTVSVAEGLQSGLFGMRDPKLSVHTTSVIGTCNELLHQLETCDRSETLQLVDTIVGHVVNLSNTASFISQSVSDKRGEGRETLVQIESYISQLNTNPTIFASLKAVVEDTELWNQMDGEGRRAVLLLLVDCQNNALDQGKEEQAAVASLYNKISEDGVSFVRGTVAPTRIPLASCPDSLLSLPLNSKKEVVLHDWCHDAHAAPIREHAWINYYKHSAKQEASLHRLLGKRLKLAKSTGYSNYAERAVRGSMAGSAGTVKEFIEEVHTQIRPAAREEAYDMEKFKYEGSKFWYNYGINRVGEVVLFPWDTHFVAEEMRQLWIHQELRIHPSLPDFLSVGSVIEQIGVWLEDTFGMTLVAERPLQGELWHPDVIKLAVEHEKEGLIGFLYLDFYSSNKKCSPPSHHPIRIGNQKQLPISVIECNYEPGNGYRPPHLNLHTLEKLFQELGAALHSMLNQTVLHVTSGNGLPADTRNIVSYLFQLLSRNPALLHHVMKHHTRTRVKPRLNPIATSALANGLSLVRGHEIENQLLYSAVDHALHTEWPYSDDRNSTEVFGRLCEQYTHLPYIEDSAPHLRFPQLFTQGGTVYGHLWSKAVATILYDELFTIDPFSRHAGEYLRENLLKLGAARSPRQMVEYLTGSKLTVDRLAGALVRPIQNSQHYGSGFMVMGNLGAHQHWHREVSSPDSPLLSRLSSSHPHLVAPDGTLHPPTKFDHESCARRRQVAAGKETGEGICSVR